MGNGRGESHLGEPTPGTSIKPIAPMWQAEETPTVRTYKGRMRAQGVIASTRDITAMEGRSFATLASSPGTSQRDAPLKEVAEGCMHHREVVAGDREEEGPGGASTS